MTISRAKAKYYHLVRRRAAMSDPEQSNEHRVAMAMQAVTSSVMELSLLAGDITMVPFMSSEQDKDGIERARLRLALVASWIDTHAP